MSSVHLFAIRNSPGCNERPCLHFTTKLQSISDFFSIYSLTYEMLTSLESRKRKDFAWLEHIFGHQRIAENNRTDKTVKET
jgi:hypothetical protein